MIEREVQDGQKDVEECQHRDDLHDDKVTYIVHAQSSATFHK